MVEFWMEANVIQVLSGAQTRVLGCSTGRVQFLEYQQEATGSAMIFELAATLPCAVFTLLAI